MRYILGVLVAGLLLGGDVLAQGARVGTAPRAGTTSARDEVLRVRKFTAMGNNSIVRSPVFDVDVRGGTKPAGQWVVIEVEYDTAPEWIDELTFKYTAMALTTEEGKRKYSLYKTTVRYVDIAQDRGHRSTVFLHPKALKRYGELIGAVVEILHEGKVVAVESDSDARAKLPAEWWENPRVTENELVTNREGYLLNRAESPWALINIDDYEVIR